MSPREQQRATLPVEVVRAAELARLRDVERVAREFCARCERGEIRSVATYERFRAALAGCGVAAIDDGSSASPGMLVSLRHSQ